MMRRVDPAQRCRIAGHGVLCAEETCFVVHWCRPIRLRNPAIRTRRAGRI
ncbi:MAG: hypothetical protein IPL43_05875 [Micropruina sp.]|nr:hypothetical protein [Micropruina sp.]